MTLNIRALHEGDLGAALPLIGAEGWTFELEELVRLWTLGGATGAFDGRRLVGFLSYVDLAPMRWIGNVAVAPAARGSGLGARLIEATLAAPGPVTSFGLYSVEKAVTLYARLGFAAQGEAWAFRAEEARPRKPARNLDVMQDTDLPGVFRLDRDASGMDRRGLLGEMFASYADTSCVLSDGGGTAGFGFAKTYSDLTEIGPLVTRDPKDAVAILDGLLQETPGPHEATVLGTNAAIMSALEERGFARSFRTVPMFKGTPPKWTPAMTAIAAGLEKS